jgi:hypothetical protein
MRRLLFYGNLLTVCHSLELGLVAGCKRANLERAFAAVLEDDLEQRVLPFDEQAAGGCPSLRSGECSMWVARFELSRSLALLPQGASLATLSVRHFGGLEIPLVGR